MAGNLDDGMWAVHSEKWLALAPGHGYRNAVRHLAWRDEVTTLRAFDKGRDARTASAMATVKRMAGRATPS